MNIGHNLEQRVNVIGTCSLCGGRVVVPVVVMSGFPVEPWCSSCGAVKREPIHGPILDMVKK
jgi:hypothetical protein